MMHEGCKMNEKIKLKRKTETKNATKHKKKTWHAKDDGTRYKPKHDIDTRTCYSAKMS